MEFEWDENKNRLNQEKHGVSFEAAKRAFVDPNRKIKPDAKHSQHEARYFCFGKVDGRILTVRFTIRGNKIRVIGVGEWRTGRKKYEED
ncbi:MAG: BrnT family toxin [Verrucomicrobiales bacterium]|jgi:uncharacterized DUF497 family protein|nr:BrnT family toxin [Verrucomicrobiales bacterium]